MPPSPAAESPADRRGIAGPGLYVHVPFCSAICPYCDFAVTKAPAPQRAAYVEALLAEARLWAPRWQGAAFTTVYLGGGTPSHLASERLAALLSGLRAELPVAVDAWLTLEVNPEDADPGRLAAFRAVGVDTVSLGVQSFDPAALKLLGRRHDPEAARRAVEAARGAGFHTVSLDLIFGLPGEPADGLRRTLETAVELAPDHVSCYQLTFHQGTPFGRALERGRMAELPESDQAERYRLVHDVLGAAGYHAYEVSNFARAPEHRSRHNQKYWRHVPYLGLGPSAHSYADGKRWWNERDLAAWERRLAAGEPPVAGDEALTADQIALEELMLGLRTADGVDLDGYRRRHGIDLIEAGGARLERLIAEGVLVHQEHQLRPSRHGLAVADGLPAVFDLERGAI